MEEISEEKLEQIITTIEENITLHDCRNENCEAYWIVENRQQVKTWIQEIIIGGLTSKQEDLIMETAREKYLEKKYENETVIET